MPEGWLADILDCHFAALLQVLFLIDFGHLPPPKFNAFITSPSLQMVHTDSLEDLAPRINKSI